MQKNDSFLRTSTVITRIYVDNFRCLTNFTLSLGEASIFLGGNGSGKSTVFDVLRKVQQLVVGKNKLEEVFSQDDLSMHQDADRQSIELDMVFGSTEYRYTLTIGHRRDLGKMRIDAESLYCNGHPLFQFETGEAQLYRDDHTEGPTYPFDWTQSGVGHLYERHDNKKLSRFKKELANVVIVRPCPVLFESESRSEDEFLESTMRNFVGWYRHTAQENMGGVTKLFQELADILPGFNALVLAESGEKARALRAVFGESGREARTRRYAFHQLSDGQRSLIALYSLLFLAGEQKMSLFVDEPDNYLSLREVQPWVASASDALGETLEQVVVISHHPVTIDYLANGNAKWFYRDGEGPVRVSDEPEASNDALSASELIARGWDRKP